ncbi:MAG: hypothetical protein JWM80_4685 [Cyanobacteria bacterium RYN_339]|nr:hypothetical protein [Cyanobacteria bacterium RYN_339]
MRGTVLYGGTTSGSSGALFLKLNDSVSVFIAPEVWEATGLGDAAKLKGKKVAVRARPRAGVNSGSVALTVNEPDDIKVVN